MNAPPTWTPERVDALKAMWADGISASVIADRLGGVTRNAVIGKTARLGLSGRVTCVSVARLAPRKPVQRDKPPLVPNASLRRTAAPEPPVARQTASEPVTILELRFPISQCRWPLGEPSADMLYCGARTVEGSPYCGYHHRIAYVPYVPRRLRMEAAE